MSSLLWLMVKILERIIQEGEDGTRIQSRPARSKPQGFQKSNNLLQTTQLLKTETGLQRSSQRHLWPQAQPGSQPEHLSMNLWTNPFQNWPLPSLSGCPLQLHLFPATFLSHLHNQKAGARPFSKFLRERGVEGA